MGSSFIQRQSMDKVPGKLTTFAALFIHMPGPDGGIGRRVGLKNQ